MISAADWKFFPNFTESEFACLCGCGLADMDLLFMERLQRVRTALDAGMVITSGFRCPEYNARIGGAAGVHPSGHASDIAIAGERVFHLQFLAFKAGMQGIGLRQHGPWNKRFVHLDDLTDLVDASGEPVRPRIWTYK